MGLFLRYNLFYQVDAEDVYGACTRFYWHQQHGKSFVDEGLPYRRFTLHERDGDWTVLDSGRGEYVGVLRELQKYVSWELNCPGFLIFVYDGDWWGYEFVRNGEALDRFVQNTDDQHWLPGESVVGDAGVLAQHFPSLDQEVLQRYLVHWPRLDEWVHAGDQYDKLGRESEARKVARAEFQRLIEIRNVKAQPGDEFLPFDECSVLDFLRYLGVRVELRDLYVTLLAPELRRWWVSGQNR